MPRKILGWLGKENAPLLLRYGAIPHMWRWGLAFAANCTPERFRANTLANLALALHSLRSLQEIGAETGIAYDRAANGVLKIYRSRDLLDAATRGCEFLAGHGLLFERLDGPAASRTSRRWRMSAPPWPAGSISRGTRSATATSSRKVSPPPAPRPAPRTTTRLRCSGWRPPAAG